MHRLVLLGLVTVSTAALAGCRSLAPPNFARPGTAQYQRSMAQQFDPYPENEAAPAVVGGRPLGYQKPAAEVLRARWFRGNCPGL